MVDKIVGCQYKIYYSVFIKIWCLLNGIPYYIYKCAKRRDGGGAGFKKNITDVSGKAVSGHETRTKISISGKFASFAAFGFPTKKV